MNDITPTRDEALRHVCALWELTVQSGWSFAHALREALDTVCSGPDQRADFLSDVATQTGVTVKRLQNVVSLSKNPAALVAEDMGLEVSYGETVAGMDVEHAEYFLSQVADGQIQTVAALRREIWTHNAPANYQSNGNAPSAPVKRELMTITIYPTDTPDIAACRIISMLAANTTFLAAMVSAIAKTIDAPPANVVSCTQ
jgi:hypothetical protein